MRKVDIALLSSLLEQTEKIQGSYEFASKKWDVYFEVIGFKEFSAISGYNIEEFQMIYQEFQRVVQEYYTSFKGDYGANYYPLAARIGTYGGLNFRLHFEKVDYRRYSFYNEITTINILQGDYFVAGKRGTVNFLRCEEVIKRLIYLYKDNQVEFDRAGRSTGEYFPIVRDKLDVLKSLHY